MLKKLNIMILVVMVALGMRISSGWSEEVFVDDFIEYDDYSDDNAQYNSSEMADEMSVQALQEYNMSGSLFEKITMLEQEKVVAQLEKERAQLDLDLDRLNAERIKLQLELDTLSGRAEQQKQELETAKTQLEIQTEKLRQQRNAVDNEIDEVVVARPKPKKEEGAFSKRYKLINVVGVDNQLQATVQELSTGQNKRIAVGRDLDGYIVKSISLNDGIIFEKDGVEESLNIGK